MNKIARITLNIPGENRHIAAEVLLADLAKKLHHVDLSAGLHTIIVFNDGSVVLDNAMQWEPRQLPPTERQRKVGT